MKIRKMLGHKTLRCKYTTTSSREKDELGQVSHNLLEQSLLNACVTCVPFYGSLNNPFIYLGLAEKKAHRQIHGSQENHS